MIPNPRWLHVQPAQPARLRFGGIGWRITVACTCGGAVESDTSAAAVWAAVLHQRAHRALGVSSGAVGPVCQGA